MLLEPVDGQQAAARTRADLPRGVSEFFVGNAVAVGEPLLDERGELALDGLVAELLELGAVLADELPDPLVDAHLHRHSGECTTAADILRTRPGRVAP